MTGDHLYVCHMLIHDYMGVDIDEVWNVVANDFPVLKGQLVQILNESTD